MVFLIVKVKSPPTRNLANQKAHQAGAYLRFLQYEASRSISTPPGWDTSPSQVTFQHFVRLSPSNWLVIGWFIQLGGERHCET